MRPPLFAAISIDIGDLKFVGDTLNFKHPFFSGNG
jgi:hypothetical protein